MAVLDFCMKLYQALEVISIMISLKQIFLVFV